MNLSIKYLVLFSFFFLSSFTVRSQSTNQKINNAIIFNEALKNENLEVAYSFLDRMDEIELEYVDPDNGNNLFFNLIVFFQPSDVNRNVELQERWKKLLDIFLANENNYKFIQNVGEKDNLITLLGKYSSQWMAKYIIEKIKQSDNEFIKTFINHQNSEGSSGLHYSLQNMNIPLSKYYIELGINLDLQDQIGISPIYLHLANYYRFLDLQKENEWNDLFNLLLAKSKLDLKLKLDPNRYYPTLTLLAASIGEVSIIERIADKTGDLFAIFQLEEEGATRNSLSVAIENSREEMTNYLFEKLKLPSQPTTARRGISVSNSSGKFKKVIQAKNSKGDNLLHLASKNEFLLPVEILSSDELKNEVDVNLENTEGVKPIDYCFKRVRKPVVIIDGLVAHPNINLGLPLQNGKDLFTNLTQYEVVNAIKTYLNKFEPKWNRIDQNNNPVYLKLLSLKNYDIYQEVMKSLDKFDLSLVDSFGANITHYLVYYGGAQEYFHKIFELRPSLFTDEDQIGQNTLFRAAVAVNEIVYANRSEVVNPVQILLELGIDYDFEKVEKQKQRNLAHLAIANRNQILFSYLINHYPQLFGKEDVNKATPLHFAASLGQDEYVSSILGLKNINFDLQDELRKYPIHHAFESGDDRTIKHFIENEIQLDVVSNHGETIIELLLQDVDWQDLVEDYIDKKPAAVFDGLIEALEIEDYWYIQYFLEMGANPNQKIERGEYNGLFPIMVPIVNRNKKILDFLVTGHDSENPNDSASREKMDLNVLDSNGRSIIAHAIESQDVEILELIKEWDIDFNVGTSTDGQKYISHNLIFAANYFDWNLGSKEEIENSVEMAKILFQFKEVDINILDREGMHWALSALRNNNGFFVAEAIKKWPELKSVKFNNERLIDLVIKGRHWMVMHEGIPKGLEFNSNYNYKNQESIEALKSIFDYWGYSEIDPYLELIDLGMDTDYILEALDGLFERDDLLLNIELYTEQYIRDCKRRHRENNQEYRIVKEDNRVYPFLSHSTACISPDIWESISEKDEFKAKQVNLP